MAKCIKESLEQRVLGFIQGHNLISRGQTLVVAVSGGQDSVCLLHILNKLQADLGIKLHVAHLDHQLRGAESLADARYVAKLARQLGIPATIEKRNVKAYRAKLRISLEEAAREVRYEFLGEVARATGAGYVALGHTTDDQIETVLMHIIRGTGTKGLRGLQPVSQIRAGGKALTLIRPLLSVSRQETEDYCNENGLRYQTDASNESFSLLRNRIRHKLLPLLKEYNPGIREALLRTASIAADDFEFLDKESKKLWERVAQEQNGAIIFDKKGLIKLQPSQQRYLLRMAIESLLGDLKDIETRHIAEILNVLDKPAGKSLNLPEGLVFTVEYNRFTMGKDSAGLSPFAGLEGEHAIKVPGETLLPGWRIKTSLIKPSLRPEDKYGLVSYFNFDKTGDKMRVRTRRRGDRFQPLGMEELKTVGEFMIDAKIPRAWRDKIPVVSSQKHILWLVGYRIDDRVKVTEKTNKIIRMEFERI